MSVDELMDLLARLTVEAYWRNYRTGRTPADWDYCELGLL